MDAGQQSRAKEGAPVVGMRLLIAFAAALCAASPAQAFRFKAAGINGSFDSVLSYGMQVRMQDQDCQLIALDAGGCAALGAELSEASADVYLINADDGDQNYKKGDVVSAVFKGLHELYLKQPDWGTSLLVRYSELYDFKIDDTRRTEITEEGKKLAVRDHRLLDAWIGQDFDLFERNGRIRVGSQVLTWGESIFTIGGINTINAIDLRRMHTPGTQLKELYRPAPMVSLSLDLTDTLSMESYWQWKWNEFQLDAAGTYFSTADVAGEGADRALYIPTSQVNAGIAAIPGGTILLGQAPSGTLGDPGATGLSREQLLNPDYVIPRLADGLNRPEFLVRLGYGNAGSALPYLGTSEGKDSGQWGLSFRYRPEWFSGSFGLYYIEFNEKIPFVSFKVTDAAATSNPVSAGFKLEYPDGRRMIGGSVSTTVGSWGIGSELAYQPKQAVMIDTSVPSGNIASSAPYACVNGGGEAEGKYCKGWVDEEKYQFAVNGLQVMSPADGIGQYILRATGASEGMILLEVSGTYYPGLDVHGGIPWSMPSYSLPDPFSWGYTLSSNVAYPNVFGLGWTVMPQLDLAQGVQGSSPNALPWVANTVAATTSLNFVRRGNQFAASLGYTKYSGGGNVNLVRDRDFLSFAVTYSF
ncbi:DUF1302 domain-containing protein [Stagnimonas aquatica]|uniref:DUF1302 domain-containing protein n=1 Tax=Stagnimonas aquatica TaxID=2689987 RepID=A0A3N0VJV2_9GAMM|nr:DUF1302 domain-containing protein [Stagnimonas aquatica]ROH93044.1 DUF1302 domain-containing protein [Stagnimonas aquatica]